jgi:hypothetical protein
MPKKYLLSYQTTMMIVLADNANEARFLAREATGELKFLSSENSSCSRISGGKGVFATFKTAKKGV